MAYSRIIKILNAVIVSTLTVTNGLGALFLPKVQVSSSYDPAIIYVPILSYGFMVALLCSAVIFICRHRINKEDIFYVIVSCVFMLCSSYFAVNSLASLSYSSNILGAAVMAVSWLAYSNNFDRDIVSLIRMIAFVFFLDFFLNLNFNGSIPLVSILFASNGYSFISFLCALILIVFFQGGKWGILEKSILIIFVLAGVLSSGKVALFSFIISLLFIQSYRAKMVKYTAILFAGFLLFNEKADILIDSVSSTNEDALGPLLSTLHTRLDLWNIFTRMFIDYPIGGVGGLYINSLKYDFGYTYDVFIDPHNEFVFWLSGGGIFVFALIFNSFIYFRCFAQRLEMLGNERSTTAIFIYLVLTSLTNANSAKMNIGFFAFFILFILLAYSRTNSKRIISNSVNEKKISINCDH